MAATAGKVHHSTTAYPRLQCYEAKARDDWLLDKSAIGANTPELISSIVSGVPKHRDKCRRKPSIGQADVFPCREAVVCGAE